MNPQQVESETFDQGVNLKVVFGLSLQATWHPVYDLIVAGRYPDDRVCPGDQRTIDIFDSNTSELVCQLQDPNAAGIKSVSEEKRALTHLTTRGRVNKRNHISKLRSIVILSDEFAFHFLVIL